MITTDTLLLGPSQLNAAKTLAIFLRRPSSTYTLDDTRTILAAYQVQCAAVGLRTELVLAQLAVETGWLSSWWCARPRRNPAGIGVTGRHAVAALLTPKGVNWALDEAIWREGLSFTSWVADAIPCHLGRLLAYALPGSEGTVAQRGLIASALTRRGLPVRYQGCAPTLAGLGGTWAADPEYPTKLAEVARLFV